MFIDKSLFGNIKCFSNWFEYSATKKSTTYNGQGSMGVVKINATNVNT